MPCNSDYLEPSFREKELSRAARLCCYVLRCLGREPPQAIQNAAEDLYPKHDAVPFLCGLLGELSHEQREAIVYNARDRESRDLADWWEDHLAADAAREQQQAQIRQREELRQSAFEKLTPEEKEALKG